MEIKRVVPSGFCKGVVHAIALAKKTREDYPDETITVLGMIVHNAYVTEELGKLGIVTLDDDSLSKEELLEQIDSGIVIFTAHGISDHIKQRALEKGLRVVDASCEDVLKTRTIIKDYLSRGYDVLYFGKKGHPEAEAILSISSLIHLLTGEKDIDDLELESEKILITNQTTMSYLELKDLFVKVKQKWPHAVLLNEICSATSMRQKAIYDLTDCDLLYIVGDPRSNNTSKLREIAEKRGIKKVFLIRNASEIDKEDLNGAEHVYVSAGASTPPELIREVMDLLRAEAL